MRCRQCDVIGCSKPAAWARTAQADDTLEDTLCNGCWLELCASRPEQAACYVVCNADLATPDAYPSCGRLEQIPAERVTVIR